MHALGIRMRRRQPPMRDESIETSALRSLGQIRTPFLHAFELALGDEFVRGQPETLNIEFAELREQHRNVAVLG